MHVFSTHECVCMWGFTNNEVVPTLIFRFLNFGHLLTMMSKLREGVLVLRGFHYSGEKFPKANRVKKSKRI